MAQAQDTRDQAWRVVATGGQGLAGLRRETMLMPAPGPGEALVRFAALTLNYRDLIGIEGGLPGLTREPDYVPLSCGVGQVVAIGADVTRVAIGQRVAPIFALGWHHGGAEGMGLSHLGGHADGVARTHGLFAAEDLVAIPAALGDLEAATLPCAGLTAWSALAMAARPLGAGDLVVLQGTGGVSIAALQLAKAAGATVAITSSSDDKLARARFLGADIGVNYRSHPDWAARVRQAAGRGATLVVDVAGSGEIAHSVAVLDPGGVIAAVGMLDGGFNWQPRDDVAIRRVTVGNRDDFEQLLRTCVDRGIRPVVDRVVPLDRLEDGLRLLKSGQFFAKIGVSVP
jgi:NADPH:quinone reductase-like Zn-dependent oxidoreductase